MLIYKCLQFTTLNTNRTYHRNLFTCRRCFIPRTAYIQISTICGEAGTPTAVYATICFPIYLFLFNGNAYRLPLIPSGPVLSRCSSFDIYGSYLYIGYIGRKQGFEYVYATEKVLSPASTKTFIQQFDRFLQFYLQTDLFISVTLKLAGFFFHFNRLNFSELF